MPDKKFGNEIQEILAEYDSVVFFGTSNQAIGMPAWRGFGFRNNQIFWVEMNQVVLPQVRFSQKYPYYGQFNYEFMEPNAYPVCGELNVEHILRIPISKLFAEIKKESKCVGDSEGVRVITFCDYTVCFSVEFYIMWMAKGEFEIRQQSNFECSISDEYRKSFNDLYVKLTKASEFVPEIPTHDDLYVELNPDSELSQEAEFWLQYKLAKEDFQTPLKSLNFIFVIVFLGIILFLWSMSMKRFSNLRTTGVRAQAD